MHYATVSLGTPSKDFLVALDTGSDLFWVPCDCVKCAPTASRSYGFVCSLFFLFVISLSVMDLYVSYSFFLFSLSLSVVDLYVPYSLFLFSLYLCFLFLTFCSLHLLYYYGCCCCCSLLSFCEDIISRYRCPYSLHYDVGDFLDEV